MMSLAGLLFGTAISYYLGLTMRSDLVLQYERFILEDLKYMEDWTDFMVENQWLEQPPKAIDRTEIVKE